MNDNEFDKQPIMLVRSHTGREYLVEREVAIALQGGSGWFIIRLDDPQSVAPE